MAAIVSLSRVALIAAGIAFSAAVAIAAIDRLPKTSTQKIDLFTPSAGKADGVLDKISDFFRQFEIVKTKAELQNVGWDCRRRVKTKGVYESYPDCADAEEALSKLKKGDYRLNKPHQLFVKEEFQLRLVLQTNANDKVDHFTNVQGKVEVKRAEVAERMHASAHGANLEVRVVGPPQRLITSKTEIWDWYVTPQKEGKTVLYVDVRALLRLPGREDLTSVDTYHEVIEIRVRPEQYWWSQMLSAWSFWLGVGGFLGTVGSAHKVYEMYSEWVRKRRLRRAAQRRLARGKRSKRKSRRAT